jgi:hypothetical protein
LQRIHSNPKEDDMASISILDRLEEGIVFRVSRSFFVVLVLIAMIGIVAGLVYFLWGITPTSKETVVRDPDPRAVVLTSDDIRAAMNRPETEQVENRGTAATTATDEKTENDLNQQRCGALVDTLRLLLPGSLYPWESDGISGKLDELFNEVSGYAEAIAPLEQLCRVLREFPEDQRLAPFNAFAALYSKRQAEYKRRLAEIVESHQFRTVAADSAYESTLLNKSVAKYQGLIGIGMGIASVASLAIFLVLLSIQRNLKSLALRDVRN